MDEPGFAGHVALHLIDAMAAPLVGAVSGVRLADAGYAWLSHFPDGARHVVTTMVDAEGDVVQWYVDVCREHGLGPDGVPWWDDLYLDVVVRPTGEALLLDEDELELALAAGYVTPAEYDLAWREARRLLGRRRYPEGSSVRPGWRLAAPPTWPACAGWPGISEEGLFFKALRLLDENERHCSLRFHQLRDDVAGQWSVPASDLLRITFRRPADRRKELLELSRHYGDLAPLIRATRRGHQPRRAASPTATGGAGVTSAVGDSAGSPPGRRAAPRRSPSPWQCRTPRAGRGAGALFLRQRRQLRQIVRVQDEVEDAPGWPAGSPPPSPWG